MHLYQSTDEIRVHQTTEAMVSIGRYVAGYRGRKNLLWISTISQSS